MDCAKRRVRHCAPPPDLLRCEMTSPSEPSARIDERREEVITEELGRATHGSRRLENTAITQLGTAKTVKVDKDNTTIINGAGKPKDISDRIRPSAV